MYIEKPEMESSREGEPIDDFSIPEWLKNVDGLNHAEAAAIRREFEGIAEDARAKRGRFSAQFSDSDGWEDEFGDKGMEFDPDSFYVN